MEKRINIVIVLLSILIALYGIDASKDLDAIDMRNHLDVDRDGISWIDTRSFPNWRVADSTFGVDDRGTDHWCDVAHNGE